MDRDVFRLDGGVRSQACGSLFFVLSTCGQTDLQHVCVQLNLHSGSAFRSDLMLQAVVSGWSSSTRGHVELIAARCVNSAGDIHLPELAASISLPCRGVGVITVKSLIPSRKQKFSY